MGDNIYDKSRRVRPARVHITDDIDLSTNAQTGKELPFVVGVMADLSGHPAEPLPKPKERRMVEIDRDNFDTVMGNLKPRLAIKVENTMLDDGSELAVELNFNELRDFSPDKVASQIEPLNSLLEARTQLRDLLNKATGNARLEDLLDTILEDAGARAKLKAALDREAANDGSGEEK
jgi:type VI secretion system protein ImpB